MIEGAILMVASVVGSLTFSVLGLFYMALLRHNNPRGFRRLVKFLLFLTFLAVAITSWAFAQHVAQCTTLKGGFGEVVRAFEGDCYE